MPHTTTHDVPVSFRWPTPLVEAVDAFAAKKSAELGVPVNRSNVVIFALNLLLPTQKKQKKKKAPRVKPASARARRGTSTRRKARKLSKRHA